MNAEQQAGTIALQRQMHAYLDSLVPAGMAESIVTTACLVAVTERVLLASSPTRAAAWLRGQALAVERFGPAMLEALRSR